MAHMAPRILGEHLNPRFFIKHYIKDMNRATEEVKEVLLDLEVLNQVLERYKALDKRHLGDLGT